MRLGTALLTTIILVLCPAAVTASEPESQPAAMLLDRTVTGPVKIAVDNGGNASVSIKNDRINLSDLIKISFTSPESEMRGGQDSVEVYYNNGDVLKGIYDGGAKFKLKFDNPFLGARQETFEDLKAVFFSSRIPRNLRGFRESCLKRANEIDDMVFLTAEPDNPVATEVRSFSSQSVGIMKKDSSGNSSIVYIDLEHVTAVVFYQSPENNEEDDKKEKSENSVAGPELAVYLTDGSRITGNISGLDSHKLTMKWLREITLNIPVTSIATAYFKNPTYAFLSDLNPSKVEETLYFQEEQEWPWRRDLSVKYGLPLTIRGNVFHKGLGVHSRSVLTYDLRGEYDTFMANVGIDDEVIQEANNGREGNVTFRIIGDGKTLFEAENVTVADPPKSVRISVRGVSSLILLVDFGKNFHVQDRADWAEPILIKKPE
ncbi:MAG: NPCBM/NEW2 domain-containing protein [Planctomycetota bacterium]